MRKTLYVCGVALLVPFGVLAAAITLWWFTTGDNVSVNVRNHSHKYVENIVVSGHGFSCRLGGMGVPGGWAFSARPRFRFDVRMAFDVDGRHYDLPGHTWMLPFGDSLVTVWLDEELKLHVDRRYL